jgi:uncharacterized membrane protein
MKALLIGLIVIAAAVFAVLPGGLGWWTELLAFMKGALPVIALFVGLIAVFIGIADLKDRAEQKKEKPSER